MLCVELQNVQTLHAITHTFVRRGNHPGILKVDSLGKNFDILLCKY